MSVISASECITDDIGVLDDNTLSVNSDGSVTDSSLSVVSQNEDDTSSETSNIQNSENNSLETSNIQSDNNTSSQSNITNKEEQEEKETKTATKISAKDIVSYNNYQDKFTVKLKAGNKTLANKKVKIVLNNETYIKTTDAKGQVSIDFKLKTGSYKVKYYFTEDDDYYSSKGTAKITVKSKIPTRIKVIAKNVTYHAGSLKEVYQLRLLDVKNNPISGKKISLKVCNVNYTAKTNSKGYATFYLSKLKKGSQTAKFSFLKSGNYASSNASAKINVKSKLTKDNGYWVIYKQMFSTNYKKLSEKGIKHIFILSSSFTDYGEKKVLNLIKKVHKYGIKVHVWLSTFYANGKFVPPAYKNGKYNYNRMNFVLNRVKYLAGLSEVDGIHFDYLRYPGTAYKYKNSVKAVNYFVKTACKAIRAKSPRIIISAAVMAEPNSMKKYYAQDIPTLSKHMDLIVPMVYKGNYRANTNWIKKTTNTFVKLSKGAQIWTGLQAYRSDSNLNLLSYNELYKDAVAAKKGGASGIILFRLGLSQNLDFLKL